MANANNTLSFDELEIDLLDRNLEDIEDLPGFDVPSPGRYVLKLVTSLKSVNQKPAVEFQYEVQSCIAKNKEEDEDAVVGTKFSNLYFLKGSEEAVAISMGKMKELLKTTAEQLQCSNLLLLLRDHLKEVLVEADVNKRQDKEDKEKFYPVIKNMKIA